MLFGGQGVLAGAALAAVISAPAWGMAASLPDGLYRCEAYMLGMFLGLGEIYIQGNVYSEPTLFGSPRQRYNYQMNANGEISWLGPLGGYTAGGNSISLTQVTADGASDASFDIVMRHSDGAYTASTCTIQ